MPIADNKAMREEAEVTIDLIGPHPRRFWEEMIAIIQANRGRHVTLARTTGWQAACACNNPNTVPPVVLDPFVGSGTTLIAALAFGYRAIGLEINPTYAEEARGYIRQKLRGNA